MSHIICEILIQNNENPAGNHDLLFSFYIIKTILDLSSIVRQSFIMYY